MASYFGEVVHPSSRAFWNDEDDGEILDSSLDDEEFSLKWQDGEPLSLDKLLIVEGETMTDFVVGSLLDSATRCVCTVDCQSGKYSSKIYAVGDVHVCIVSTKLTLPLAGQFVTTMIPLLNKARHLVLLTTDHVSHYKSEEHSDLISFLKILCSQKARSDNNSNISLLNQPNIITGVCSGVLSYAEIVDLHCIMYILYTDTFSLDSKNSLPLKKLFSETFGKSFFKFASGDASCFNKGNLYM